MELKTGYKQTEAGMIPEDWEVRKLGERATFKTGPFGSALHKSDYTVDGIPIINPMHIIDSRLVPTRTMTLTEAAVKQLTEYKLRSGDVVIGRRGDMGRCAVVSRDHEGWLCGTGSIIIRCSNGVVPDFLQRILSSPRLVSAIEDSSVGSTMINLNQAVLAGLRIQFPPLPEQRAIAAALSDVDALIAAQDRLIAKKRDLKQAAMQHLLTGTHRLPGFGVESTYVQTEIGSIPADWRVSHIRDVAAIKTGKRDTQNRVEDGGFPFFVRSQTIERINSYSYDGEAVLTAGDGVGTGKVFHYINGKFDYHQRVYKISDFAPELDGYYFYLYFSSHFYDRIMAMTAKSSVDSVRLEMIAEMAIPLPSPEEQRAIAAVLSDMDAEIAALEARRDKTRLLKQGMMQELLTGRTRLV